MTGQVRKLLAWILRVRTPFPKRLQPVTAVAGEIGEAVQEGVGAETTELRKTGLRAMKIGATVSEQEQIPKGLASRSPQSPGELQAMRSAIEL